MNKIGFFNETNQEIVEIGEIKKIINYAVEFENLDNVEFNIIFVDNDFIQSINKQYRKKEGPTDVISFALEDNKDIEIPDYRLLGDIYISLDMAKKQAREYNHTLLRELGFLSIHGFLHLLGYNHEAKEDERIMFERQELILNGYGIKK